MKTLNFLLILLAFNSMTLYDFNLESDTSKWNIVDDTVMGGRSNGKFKINEDGHGVFSGNISLKNNGGFSSLRYQTETLNVGKFSKAVLRIKGDGKNYQFRIKSKKRDYANFVYSFKTSKDWMTVEIPFNEMHPEYRGRKLDMPNYSGETIEEIIFLIGNKKEESFKLLIDKIELK